MERVNGTCRNYIDGKFVDTNEGSIEVYNPATQDLLGSVPDSSAETVDRAVEAARRAQPAWEKLAAIQRAQYLKTIARALRDNRETLAQTITREQGKVLPLARIEVDFTAEYMDYMADWARKMEGEIATSDRPGENILLFRRPLGVAAGILPWNFPLFLIARKMAPALVTGNTIVVKPSEETPFNAFAFARLVAGTDLPAGVFNLVSGRGGTTGASLSSHPKVDIVSFTGSVETGLRIMQAAAKNLTRVNLELGGKAPAIVLADADLDLAARSIHQSRIVNTGQLCNCAERVYVERSVEAELVDRLSKLMSATRYGDPITDQTIDMGPLINRGSLEKVGQMVTRAVSQGAQVVTGGKPAENTRGFHYEPTVLANCRSDMEIVRKEIFGPVLPVQAVDSLDEAIALANDSEYGLTSSIFTRDLNSTLRAIQGLRFGETYVNREHFEAMQGFHAGRRKSGIGGADGKHGLYEYTETQIVYLPAT
jgi:lactaldehyde dehydrogenase/glycolaldehyde dehydrogenase